MEVSCEFEFEFKLKAEPPEGWTLSVSPVSELPEGLKAPEKLNRLQSLQKVGNLPGHLVPASDKQ